MPEKTEKKQGRTKFQKGKSGNPKGRPTGSRNKTTILAERLLENDLEEVCSVVANQAKQGNIQAIKVILDRLLPPRRDRHIHFPLQEIKTPSDILRAMEQITTAVSSGEITPLEGESLSSILEAQSKAIELLDFEKRLQTLEEQKVS